MKQESSVTSPAHRILYRSKKMRALMQDMSRVAQTDATVLLSGESGTGKELFAEALHHLSQRNQGPFVTINCPAIPDLLLESELFGHEKGAYTGATQRATGKFEYANGGTLFLDEIGDVPPSTQVKLLRFMETHVIERVGSHQKIPVDVRVVCATHRNLDAMVAEGTFREDLYYRINQIVLRVPPVRERADDAMFLADHFFARYVEEFQRPLRGFTGEALLAMKEYPWRGNVREIGNRVKRAVIMARGTKITAADLGLAQETEARSELDLRKARLEAGAEVIRKALSEAGSNVSQAAKLLGISRPTLYSIMRQVKAAE